MDLLTRPATEILAALARRDVSAVELLDATLARIDALNPRINAVVARDAEAARRAAQASDARRAKGLDGLLEGLPMTIKDAYDVAGLVSTAGAPSWRERVPDVDAVPVARLRAAGAVILGKTNVPPWSADWVAENPPYGRTCNPWNLAHSPGGSSGGAVAALATGMTALELGSDLVASIRWPAHATGVFGLKPTWGLVSMRGHRPPSPGVDIEGDLAVAGPLARSARDLDLMLSVIAGPPALDGPRPVIAPPRRTTPQGLRVAVWASDPFAPVDHAVVAGVRRAASLLAGAGADVDADARPAFSFAEAFEVYALIAHAIVAVELPEKVRDQLAAEASSYAPDDISHRALQTRAARMDA
ncbi:MAG: amidase family protein, partial [Alsobacter sp.]